MQRPSSSLVHTASTLSNGGGVTVLPTVVAMHRRPSYDPCRGRTESRSPIDETYNLICDRHSAGHLSEIKY